MINLLNYFDRTSASAAGLGIGLLAVIGAGCEKGQASAAPPQRPPAAVVTYTAVAQDVPVYLDEIGKTVASESVVVQPQVTGKVTDIHFTDGATLKKGDLLFTIDPRPFQASLAQAQATLAQNKADADWARSEFNRFNEVQSTGAVSKTDIEQKRNALNVAEARVKAGEASVETAQLNLDYCTIRSPIAGRAGERLVDRGNIVSSGGNNSGTRLLTIQRLDPIYAIFTVTENELGTVRRFMAEGKLEAGDPENRLKVLVELPANAGSVITALGGGAPTTAPARTGAAPTTAPADATKPRDGLVTFLDNTVKDGSGTVKVRATVPNADRYFWPGQFVHVRLLLTVKKDAVLVPARAQQIGQQGPYVYVVAQGSVKDPTSGNMVPTPVAQLRPVTVGQRQGDQIVVDGVKAGEQVVVEGQMGVTPDAPVNPIPLPGQAGQPQSAFVAEGAAKS